MSRLITSINAVTLRVTNMVRSQRFYETLGMTVRSSPSDGFVTLAAGDCDAINLALTNGEVNGRWGRVILHVRDVDDLYGRFVTAGVAPEFEPRDAPWGERYFHVRDPDGHELSFAQPLSRR